MYGPKGQGNLARRLLELELNTMLDAGLSETKYWLDSGSVKRK